MRKTHPSVPRRWRTAQGLSLPLGLKFFHKQETFRCSNDQRASGGLLIPSARRAGYCEHLRYLFRPARGRIPRMARDSYP